MNKGIFNKKQDQLFQNIDFDEQQRRQRKEAAEKDYQNRLKIYSLVTALVIFFFLAIVLFRINQNRQKAIALLKEQKRQTEIQRTKVEHTLAELRDAQVQLVHSEKMASLGEVTAGIAHEIENPLNFVNNFSEVNRELLNEMKEEISKGNLEEISAIASAIIDNEEKISQHGKRADSIVKGMLQHSRTSVGQKQPTDINTLADEYLRLSYHGIRAKDKSFNADLQTNFEKSIGMIDVVPQDIGRVLLNIYNNAIYAVMEKKKHSDASYKPAVSVKTSRENGKIVITVKDNGIGIPASAKDKIFQPFFTTKPAGQGTGLGLSMSYDIIKAHGGEIIVKSSDGNGAEFVVLLPV